LAVSITGEITHTLIIINPARSLIITPTTSPIIVADPFVREGSFVNTPVSGTPEPIKYVFL